MLHKDKILNNNSEIPDSCDFFGCPIRYMEYSISRKHINEPFADVCDQRKQVTWFDG
jgi:hypothetical protein